MTETAQPRRYYVYSFARSSDEGSFQRRELRPADMIERLISICAPEVPHLKVSAK